jgi:hypothetical protein
MPKIREELQFVKQNENSVHTPLEGVSLFLDNNRALKVKHSDGTVETILTQDDLTFALNNNNYYTKEQVDNILSQAGTIAGFTIVEGNSLPVTPAAGFEDSIHLLLKPEGGYSEWLYVNGSWERVGEDDLSTYATQSDLSNAASKVTFKDWTR